MVRRFLTPRYILEIDTCDEVVAGCFAKHRHKLQAAKKERATNAFTVLLCVDRCSTGAARLQFRPEKKDQTPEPDFKKLHEKILKEKRLQ